MRLSLGGADRVLSATLVMLFSLLILALASPPFFGLVHIGDDLGNLHLPVRSVYQTALHAHHSVLWTSQLYAGMYLHGEGQAGMYHPLHWLLYGVFPLSWAFTLEFVLSYAVMFWGMYLFLRRLELPRPAGLFGAIVFTFSGFNLLHFMHVNAVAVVAHLPWLLFGIDLLLRSTDWRQVALAQLTIALGTGSQLLLGHPQFVWLSLVAEVSYAAWRARRAVSPWRLGLFVWAVGVGVLLGAVQLVPTMEMLGESERSNPSAEFRATYSLHLANLLQLVSPYGLRGRVVGGNVQEFGLYNGAISSVALGWLLLRWRGLGRWRSLTLACCAFGLVMLLLAFGSYGGLYSLISRLPLVGVFRAPARYVVLLHLALAIVAAVMMADLMRLARRRRRPRRWSALWPLGLVGGVSLATLAVHAWMKSDPARHPAAVHLWPVGFAALGTTLILTASVLVLAAFRGVRWAPWCLAVFTVADLALWGGSFVWRERPQPLAQRLEVLPEPPGSVGDGRVHVTGGMDWLYQNVLVVKGYRLASGYVGLRPKRALSPEDVTAQRLLGVRWVFSNGNWAPVDDPLPRIRMVAEARPTGDVAGDLSKIDIRRTALVAQPVGQLRPDAEATARPVRDEPGFIEIRTTSATRQLLVLSEAYHAGWKATQDGRPTPIYRAYGDLQACAVDPGEHLVVFRFEPWSLVLGRRLSQVGLVLAAAPFFVLMILGRRRLSRPSTQLKPA